MNKGQATEAVRALLGQHAHESTRLDRLHRAGQAWTDAEAARAMDVDVHRPNGDRNLRIAKMSQTPFLGLVLDTFGQSLKADNFFTSAATQASAWVWWQRNRMGARQTGLHRAALQYGTAYSSVLPAKDEGAVIGVHSPRRMVTFYGEPSSVSGAFEDWPIIAAQISAGGSIRLYDEKHVHFFGADHVPGNPRDWSMREYLSPGNLQYVERREHNVGVTPIVRYQDRMMTDGEATNGIIEPLLGMAQRINRTNYEQGVAAYWSAFKQRYIIGWAPEDEQQALRQAASETWFFDDENVKAGQFDATDLAQYTDMRQAAVRDFAAVAQVPASSLGANAISNISAEGLAALENSKHAKASEIQTSLGESHEQTLRLVAHIAGDHEEAEDFGSEIKWADTTPRSFAQTVDGLGKLATMLGVPADELWSDIPGWTRERVQRVLDRNANRPSVEGLGLFDDGEELL